MKNKAFLFYLFIILLLTCLIYSNSLFNGFVGWDDNDYILNNQDITSFSLSNLHAIFSRFYVNCYLPLTMLSFSLEYKFFGLNPFIYHLSNLILHLLNVCLVFFFVRAILQTSKLSSLSTEHSAQCTKLALLVSLLFAINPLHVESVAWISERKDLLYSFFYLCSLIFYIKYLKEKNVDKKHPLSIIHYSFSIIFFILSLLCKPTAITLPLVLFLIDYHFSGRSSFIPLLSFFSSERSAKSKEPETDAPRTYLFAFRYLPFIILSIVFAFINFKAQSSYGALENIHKFNLFDRIFFITDSLLFYIIKIFVPVNLSFAHPFPLKTGHLLPYEFYFYFFIIILIYVVGFIYYRFTRNKLAFFGALFFQFTICLTVNIIPFGRDIVAERYTYIPCIGLLLIFAVLIDNINNLILYNSPFNALKLKIYNYICFILFASYIFFLSYSTFERNKVWQNRVTLFTDVINKHPDAPQAYAEIGIDLLFNQLKYEESIKNFNKAIYLQPDFALALCNRGVAKNFLGFYNSAIDDFNKAISLNPDYALAYANRSNSKSALGDVYGQLDDLNKTISLNPGNPTFYFNRGICEQNLNLMQKACEDWKKARLLGLNDINLNYLINKSCK